MEHATDITAAPYVTRHDNAGVTTLTLNRPQQFNNISRLMIAALHEALNALAADTTVRAVVIAAAGKAFCAGHDPKEMRSDASREFQAQLFAECGAMMHAITQLPQPVIARVQGMAAAAGCQLVGLCDLAVAAESARFAAPGIKLGLFCSTPAVALTRNIGRKRAFEMLATGEAIDAHEAQRLGLVNHAVPDAQLDATVEQLASTIAAKSRIAMSIGKQAFYAQVDAPLSDAMQIAAAAMTENMLTADARHGFDCFLAKKTPSWIGA